MHLLKFSPFPILFILGWITGSFYRNPPIHYIDATRFYVVYPRNVSMGGIVLGAIPDYMNPNDADSVYTLVRNELEKIHVAKTETLIEAQADLNIEFVNHESFKCGSVDIALGCQEK